MPDHMTRAQRSRAMKRVKLKDGSLEKLVQRELRSKGLKFRRHVRTLPGSPDIVFPEEKVAVFVGMEISGTAGGCRHGNTSSPNSGATNSAPTAPATSATSAGCVKARLLLTRFYGSTMSRNDWLFQSSAFLPPSKPGVHPHNLRFQTGPRAHFRPNLLIFIGCPFLEFSEIKFNASEVVGNIGNRVRVHRKSCSMHREPCSMHRKSGSKSSEVMSNASGRTFDASQVISDASEVMSEKHRKSC